MIGKLHIKVCGMKLPVNRESLEELPVDFFGFIFYPASPRYVAEGEDDMMFSLLSTAKFRTGVFVDAHPDKIFRIARKYKLTHIQLHGRESSGTCKQIEDNGFKVIKSFSLHPDFDFSECDPYAGTCSFFLFDTKGKQPGGNGEKFKWQILDSYRLQVPFFLSGGISPGDEHAILRLKHPFFFGIDLNSGFEDAPGIKNPGKVKDFIDKLFEKLMPHN
jgi:phosphoribosylanthranilate isomerase